MKNKTIIAILFLVLFGANIFVSGQTINGTIIGTVTDAAGAVIPGANVIVRDNNTGYQRTLITDENGRYRSAGLSVGVYTVRIEKAGFAPTVRTNVSINAGTETDVSLSLQAGDVQAEVVVTATEGELLDTTQSQVIKTVDQVKILELPGRNNLNGLALLNPGVVPNQNNRPGSGFAVNGN
ncbi:MAG TPA: carboxypeptidase-like regulatory domain-containing protein, partial [Pyrinomonadaceae bacterium]|nr:carboxypeptidase-like regulatory domain-containing protein [Pyrinomonadaceae bacterium]